MSGNPRCIWFGEMEYYMDESFISRTFASLGEPVTGVKMIRHKTTGSLASYCFVEFADQSQVERVLSSLNGKPIPGTNPEKHFKLNYAVYGKDNPNYGIEYSLFVGDLTADVTDQILLTFFQLRYPSVKAAKIVNDSQGKSKGFGFVRFFDEGEIKRALVEMQNAVGCGQKPIRVSPATNKSKRGDKQTQNASVAPIYSGATSSPYYTSYDQYTQQYQQYLNAWNQQQMSSVSTATVPSMTWEQYYQAYYQQPVAMQPPSEIDKEEDEHEQTPVDPDGPPLNIQTMNKEMIDTEMRLYFEMDESRWHPLDSPFVTVPSAPVMT